MVMAGSDVRHDGEILSGLLGEIQGVSIGRIAVRP